MNHREFDNYLTLLSSLLKLGSKQRQSIAEELRDHLEERVSDLTDRGVSEEEAIAGALADFGGAAGLAAQFSQIARTRRKRTIMKFTAGSAAAMAILVGGIYFLWSDPGARLAPAPLVAQDDAAEPFGGTADDPPPTSTAPSEEERARSLEIISDLRGQPIRVRRGEERIYSALDSITALEFLDTPLRDAIVFLEDSHEVPIMIDVRALDEVGLSADVPVTLRVHGVTLQSALNLLLQPLDLTYQLRDEVLMITTREAMDQNLQTRIYAVTPWLVEPGGDYDSLIQLITTILVPESWETVGGPANISVFEPCGSLVISQTTDAHVQIGDLLLRLYAMRERMKENLAAP